LSKKHIVEHPTSTPNLLTFCLRSLQINLFDYNLEINPGETSPVPPKDKERDTDKEKDRDKIKGQKLKEEGKRQTEINRYRETETDKEKIEKTDR
jgi:hypothetical protein